MDSRHPQEKAWNEALHAQGIPATHVLKTFPPYFEDILMERKCFDVRYNDRDYHVGDVLDLVEYDIQPDCEIELYHTGRNCFRKITYLLKGGRFGIDAHHVVLGIEPYEPSPLETVNLEKEL